MNEQENILYSKLSLKNVKTEMEILIDGDIFESILMHLTKKLRNFYIRRPCPKGKFHLNGKKNIKKMSNTKDKTFIQQKINLKKNNINEENNVSLKDFTFVKLTSQLINNADESLKDKTRLLLL